MLPGSQSSKLKQATLGISGDPRFRLTSTLPKGPWAFVLIVAAAIVVAAVVMLVADSAQSRQQNVVAVHDCVVSVHAAIDANTHVLNEEQAAAAAPCFSSIQPIGVAAPDQLVVKIHESLATVRRLHQAGGNGKAEVDATRTLLDHIDEFNRWYIQNRAHFGIR